MKKTLALIMALALVLCSASAFAAREKDAYTWAKALPDDAKFMFDYSRMQPVPAVKLGSLTYMEDTGEVDVNGNKIYIERPIPDLVTTSGDKEVVLGPNGLPIVKTDPVTGDIIPVDFAHLSKAEIAWWNERLNQFEYDTSNPFKWPYPVNFDGNYSDTATDHNAGADYNVDMNKIVVDDTTDPVTVRYIENIYPDAAKQSTDTIERDRIEATFTETQKTPSTPYGIGIEYTYSYEAPNSANWSKAEKSTLVPTGRVYEDPTGKYQYEYVNKEVSNTPAANVATTTNRTENYISTAFAAGFLASELNPDASSDQTLNVVPVDLTEDGTYVYPIVSKAHTIVGLVWATVEDGYVTIDGQLRDQVKRYGDDFTLKIYTSVDQLAKKGTAYEIGEAIATEEFGDAIFFEIKGKVQYHWSIGASKAGDYSIYWTLQDYWRYETRWKLYRNSLRDIVDLLAAE